jgi:hypothetical protein
MNGNVEISSIDAKQANSGRRSFLWKAGSALSVLFAASVPGVASEAPQMREDAEGLTLRVGTLEDARAIQQLHRLYGEYLGKGMHEEIIKLFAEDGRVSLNGGLFYGRDKGIRRLYAGRFGRALSEVPDGPVHLLQVDWIQPEDAVDVAPDGLTATARFHCLMRVAAWDTTKYPMMDLARAQGQGLLQWWEHGLYEISYVKAGGIWKIGTLSYRSQALADDMSGWSSVSPAYLPPFTKKFPEDPAGPDKLIFDAGASPSS